MLDADMDATKPPADAAKPPMRKRTRALAIARTLDLNELLDIAIERLREMNARDRAGEIP